jgi:hypothetical protein
MQRRYYDDENHQDIWIKMLGQSEAEQYGTW